MSKIFIEEIFISEIEVQEKEIAIKKRRKNRGMQFLKKKERKRYKKLQKLGEELRELFGNDDSLLEIKKLIE